MGALRPARREQARRNGVKPKVTNKGQRTMGTKKNPIATLPRETRPTLKQTIRTPGLFRAGKILSTVAFLSAFGINVARGEVGIRSELYKNINAASESLAVQGLKAEPIFTNGEEQIVLRKIPKKEQLEAVRYKLVMDGFRGLDLKRYDEIFFKLNKFLKENPKFIIENADMSIGEFTQKMFGFFEPDEFSTLTIKDVLELSKDSSIKRTLNLAFAKKIIYPVWIALMTIILSGLGVATRNHIRLRMDLAKQKKKP